MKSVSGHSANDPFRTFAGAPPKIRLVPVHARSNSCNVRSEADVPCVGAVSRSVGSRRTISRAAAPSPNPSPITRPTVGRPKPAPTKSPAMMGDRTAPPFDLAGAKLICQVHGTQSSWVTNRWS
jgi:hypothetical protein